jgi:hypothetical protein
MLDERQILNIIGNELNNSAGGISSSDSIEYAREAALATYLGQPDGKEVEGRSSIISTDVADAIEWIMPEVMKAFTQNNEVVTFDAVCSGDEEQAEMESKYVYDILMKENNGFLILHQFVKDALMQKNGFLKVFYERTEDDVSENYTGLTEQESQMILADPELELTAMTQYDDGTFDVSVDRKIVDSKVCVVSVPPEEFRVNREHNSVDLTDARFTAHVVLKTAGELVNEGYSKDFVDAIPSSPISEEYREYRFYMQGETVTPIGQTSTDPSQRLIEVTECFLDIDIQESGKPKRMKITVAGGDSPTVILGDPEEVVGNPFISATAILMSHKLFGLSIYDRLKSIQAQKTALWRNIFDNMYLQNNQRTIVVENQVNIDDLLVSRPGGIIRVKRADAIAPYVTPPLPGDSYKMMDYLDQVRAGRSGVSPEGPVTDNMIGDRVGSQGVAQMLSQKEELVGLMIRVFAETGLKPLCYKIRETVIKHQDTVKEYKFKGRWVQINPTKWRNRKTSTVRVGTGSGNRQQQLSAITQIMLIQEKMLSNPGQALVVEDKVYKAVDDFAKFSGMPGASPYFLDPASPEGQQNKQRVQQAQQAAQQQAQQAQQAEIEFQKKIADAETQKANAQAQNVQLKGQVDTQKNLLLLQKQEQEANESMLKQQLAEAEAIINSSETDEELTFKYWHAREQFEIQRDQIAAKTANKANDNE